MTHEDINYDYDTLLGMLNSEDQENVVLALTSLENIEVLPNIVKTLLLRKESAIGISMWNKHAPTIVNVMKENGIPFDSTVTFKQISEAGVTHKAPKEHVQLLVERINAQVLKDLRDIGYDYLKSIEVKLDYAD